MSIIEIKNLDFSYERETVLNNVNLSVKEKDFVAVIGPNGGGKSTLLKLMLGLLKPDKGNIHIDGRSPREASSCIGYVPQNIHINSNFPVTVMDVVLMGTLGGHRHFSRWSADNRRNALSALERMDMAAHANRKIGMLSGGQRQRVFIARALATQPKLLLLDEPTASIDTKGQTDLYQLLKEINQEITVLVVSHDLLAISRYVKSVACVKRTLHYHDQAEMTGDILESMYLSDEEEVCPVELVAHGFPHRVLAVHEE